MNIKSKISVLLILIFLSGSAFALDVPVLKSRVTDNAGILSSTTESNINVYSAAVEEKTGAQIAVLTVKSLQGNTIEDYSMQLAESWKLGQEKQDNGVLLLVAMNEKKIRIEVGYGLEGTLTDIKSGYIIRSIMQPAFKAGNFDAGIAGAVEAIGGVIAGTVQITDAQARAPKQSRSSGGAFNFFAFFVILAISAAFRRRRYGGSFGSALFWGAMLGSSSRRHYGGRSSGGFSGGSGFGGFSGGGGSFGGGGASGGW